MNKSNIIIILIIFALLNNSLLFHIEKIHISQTKPENFTENSQKEIVVSDLSKGIYIVVVNKPKTIKEK
jgi:hypothetical protein